MSAGRCSTSSFDYALPDGLVARYPARVRDASRLLVLDRASSALTHRRFADIVEYVEPGDAVVLNETRVIPARLLGTRASGAPAEVMLLQPSADDDAVWTALVRPGSKLRPGSVVTVAEGFTVEVRDVLSDGTRVVRLVTADPTAVALARHGHMPLPPYIDRTDEPQDRERYQTVYARADGSVAAPTAGLHFTQRLLAAVEARGACTVRVVLHVGAGTFRPVEVEDPAHHAMHAERYDVSDDAAGTINRTRAAGGRIWAVGTTVARTLESVVDAAGCVRAGSGETRLFIRPGYAFRAVDRLITNFHLPRSTLLMLVAAFAGHDRLMHAYRVAVAERYRFYSYGDAMAVL